MDETCRLRWGEEYGACDDGMKGTANHAVSPHRQPAVLRHLSQRQT